MLRAVPKLRQIDPARAAAVSKQAVNQALRRGLLRAGADGLIDPAIEPNKSWLGMHTKGFDFRARPMWTYGRPREKDDPPFDTDAFLAGLPAELAELRAELAELRALVEGRPTRPVS